MKNNVDKRIIKTHKILKDTLVNLLKDKSRDDITVYELCDCAKINRGTFYKYFNDVDDVYNAIIDDYVKEIGKYIDENFPKSNRKEYIFDSLSLIQSHYFKLKELLLTICPFSYCEKVSRVIIEIISHKVKNEVEDAERRTKFIIGGSMIVLVEVIERNDKQALLGLCNDLYTYSNLLFPHN